MDLIFSTISCPAYGPQEVAEAVKRYGYDGIELYAMNGGKLLPDEMSERLGELKDAFRDTPVVGINSWGVVVQKDADARQAQVAQIARSFELANEFGCKVVKTFGGELPDDRPVDQALDETAESLAVLADRAAEKGVTLVVETHDGFCKGEMLARLLGRVDHPALGALWDVFHPHRKGEPAAETDRLIGDRVRHLHVKDAVPESDGWRFVLCGEGQLPILEAIRALQRRGYTGAVSLDWEVMWHPSIAGPEVALPNFADGVRRMLQTQDA